MVSDHITGPKLYTSRVIVLYANTSYVKGNDMFINKNKTAKKLRVYNDV